MIGAGPHACVVIDIVHEAGLYDIVGIIDSKKDIGSDFFGYPIIGRQEDLAELVAQYEIEGGIVCIGDNYWRGFVVKFILDHIPGFEFVNAIHPSCVISKSSQIGGGNVIMAGVIINPYARIENHCIVNTNSSLEHFCIMHDFSSLSAGVTTGGYVEIGQFTAVALGVTLFDRIKIGEHTVIGSSALVTKDVGDRVLVYGVPARVIRNREIGEKYLK